MARRIFFLIFSMVLFGPCYAQTDSLHRDLTKPRPSENFPFSDIAGQIFHYYKKKFVGEYVQTERYGHSINYCFGKMMDTGGEFDSGCTTTVGVPYIKDAYFFGDLDGDGIEEIIAPVDVSGDGTGSDAEWPEFVVFKWVKKRYRIVSVTRSVDLPVSRLDLVGPADYKITGIKNGVIYGYANCYVPGDHYGDPSLFLATSHRYIKNKWVLRNTRKLKKMPGIFTM